MTEKDIEQLQRLIGETYSLNGDEIKSEIGFHCYLARITKNPMLIVLVDFADSILKLIKTRLVLGTQFYGMVKEHHKMLLKCLIAKDSHAAVMMTNDLLEVGKALAQLSNDTAFDPAEIKSLTLVADSLLQSTHLQKVVYADNPLLHETGVLFRQVGDTDLRMVSYKIG